MKLTCCSEFWSRGKGESFDICPCDWKGDNCCPVEKSTANCPEQTSTARNISTQRCQLILLQPTVRHHRVYHRWRFVSVSTNQSTSRCKLLIFRCHRPSRSCWTRGLVDNPTRRSVSCSADGAIIR